MSQQPGPQQQPPPYQQPPQQGSGQPKGRTLTILAFVFAGVAVLFVPILFGPAGIVLAIIAMNQGDPLAKWALVASIAGLVVGWLIGIAVFNAMNNAVAPLGGGMLARRRLRT